MQGSFEGRGLARLTLGPLLFVAGVVVWWVSDRFVVIGPFDRAQIGWAVAVPLLAFAPGAAGLAARDAALARASRGVALAVAIVIGLATLVLIATNVSFVGCHPVASPIEVLSQAIVAGGLAGLAFWAAYAVSAAQAARGQLLLAIVGGAATWLLVAGADVFTVFVVLFPPLSCAGPVI